MARRTKRIYYGPEGRETSIYWTVQASDAKHPVTINGNVFHALKGHAGVTVGCGLSNVAADKNNAKSFPHPVYLVAFTKTTALVVDKLKKNGAPAHAVIYSHSYGKIVQLNDQKILKKLVKDAPSIMERSFTLRPPRKRSESGGSSGPNAGQTDPNERGKSNRGRSFVPRGALARAVAAGRIGKSVAEQLESVAAA